MKTLKTVVYFGATKFAVPEVWCQFELFVPGLQCDKY